MLLIYLSPILITHCHMDGHVFIQKEWHVFMMTIFHPSYMGILLCFASPWQSLQEAQHDLRTSLTLSLEVWDVLDHEYVETREMSSIYAKQLAQLNTQQGCLLLLNVQQVRCEEIYIFWCCGAICFCGLCSWLLSTSSHNVWVFIIGSRNRRTCEQMVDHRFIGFL